MPIQQMLLGAGGSAVATKTYIDDIFSTYVYTGTGSARSINNGIDLSGEGGLVWVKSRGQAEAHILSDTVRGANNQIYSNRNLANYALNTQRITAFGSSGFSLGTDDFVNENNDDLTSWTFRKASGFFDVVTYTGNGAGGGRNINHSLSSIPGCVIVKCTSESQDWAVYHRGVGTSGKYLSLNDTDAATTDFNVWNNNPTSTYFSIGSSDKVNKNNATYVAYVFAGGESTAATARSVDFDGSGDYLSVGSSSDFTMGTGDFTVECWCKADDVTSQGVFQICSTAGGIHTGTTTDISVYVAANDTFKFAASGDEQLPPIKAMNGQWHHVALVRSSGTTSLYIDGTLAKAASDTTNYDGTYVAIGGYYSTSYLWDGYISNFRVVKGTAVYTSSFKPPTAPLTSITNTKLLCCNNSSTTGSTVTPGTITANGDPTASTDSPFDDPAGFVFGDAGDQNVIKCGVFEGDDNNTHLHHLGWEPQWILHKRFDGGSSDWQFKDTMRGWGETGFYRGLRANTTDAEETNLTDKSSPKATGFDFDPWYSTGEKVLYIAIRRPDGYVGKPPSLGTDVFAMDTGNSSNTEAFTSGFPVDMGIYREPASTSIWYATYRFTENKNLKLNTNAAEASDSELDMDNNTGFANWNGFDSTYQSWMFKRHAGFDVVTYKGNGVAGRQIPHSLNKTIEMMWVKKRNAAGNWVVYHKGVNGGTSPENYYMKLHDSTAQIDSAQFYDTAPTSTHFTVNSYFYVNQASHNYIAMLFASVDGISSVGSFVGNSSSTGPVITTGFAPRLIIIKAASTSGSWFIYDTTRGLASGNDQRLLLNDSSNQIAADDVDPSSTGFQLKSSWDQLNNSGDTYIYYAHA